MKPFSTNITICNVSFVNYIYLIGSQGIFSIFTFEIWLKLVIQVWFGVLVNCQISEFDEDSWVEESKSFMKKSNKFSFRRYEF